MNPQPLKGKVVLSQLLKDGRKEHPDMCTVGVIKSAVEWLIKEMNKRTFRDKERLIFEDIEMVGISKEGFKRLVYKAFEDVTKEGKK